MTEARYKDMWTFLIESNYEDAADIDSDMRCIICTRILINAHNSVCGCRYCLECVKAYLDGERRFCPGNTDECKVEQLDIDSNIYPDQATNHRISKLIVACRYSCGYRCELRNMEKHERACPKQPSDCPYVNVGCRESRLMSDKINKHFLRENESHARLLMACIDRLESEIASMKRDTVELRLEIAEMRFAREIDEARARETNVLVDQIKQEVANLKMENQLEKEENKSLKAQIENYRSEYLRSVTFTDQQYLEMRDQGLTQARKMELLTEKYNRSVEKLGELERETQKEKEKLRRNLNEVYENIPNELNKMEKRVHEIEVNVELQNWREFVWPIEGWAAKRQSGRDGSWEQIFSEAFYSHKNGYKMCLSADPDGFSLGKGTHLGVYFCLMRGPFDNILPWPFKGAVTFSIIDQATGTDHVSHTITFDDLPNNIDWNKPVFERNQGIGFLKMIELAELSNNAGLCRDDKLFIRCTIK